jgi:putative glutamine amidotransferase
VVLAPVDVVHVDALLERLDGLMLSGGPDIHPSAYGAEEHPALGPTERDLDGFELALVRAADGIGMPILGVCRGLQMLNVSRGGTLIQDIPDAIGEQIDHRQAEPGRIPTHAIVLDAGSRLEGVMGRQEHDVNSFHHQAVDQLGRHLKAVAWAPDGVIEGVEAPDRDFVVAVQWHAESLAEREDQAGLFSAFVAAAARYGEAGRRQEAA